jgi:hypothetical protein
MSMRKKEFASIAGICKVAARFMQVPNAAYSAALELASS